MTLTHESHTKQLQAEAQARWDAMRIERDEYLQLYTKESKLRKAVHNKLLEIQGNIRVICRVRPILGTTCHTKMCNMCVLLFAALL